MSKKTMKPRQAHKLAMRSQAKFDARLKSDPCSEAAASRSSPECSLLSGETDDAAGFSNTTEPTPDYGVEDFGSPKISLGGWLPWTGSRQKSESWRKR